MTTISAEQTNRKIGGFFNRIGSSIRTKLMLILLALTLIPILLITIFGNMRQHDALKSRTFDGLEAIRLLKGQSVATYMKSVKSPAINFSSSPPTANMAQQTKALFAELSKPELSEKANSYRAELDQYYQTVFSAEFAAQNPDQQPPLISATDLDQATVLMQARFLLGKTDTFDGVDPQLLTQYEQAYAAINKFAQGVQKTWGFSNMFVVDPDSGQILYTVSNNIDLGTSLQDGLFADEKIGEIFDQALTLNEPRGVVYSDFTKYAPTYLHPEFYISSPIFAGSERVGILVLAMRGDKLSSLMQLQKGLGKTGQTYLVGSDYLWRTESPLLADMDVSTTVLNEATRSEVPGVIAALNGESGTDVATNYRGEDVLMSWQPLVIQEASGDIPAIRWAMIAEISRAEVDRPARLLLIQTAIGLAVAVAAVVFFSNWVSKQLTRQIDEVHSTFDEFEDENFDARITVTTNDELGQMAGRMNNAFDTMTGLIQTSNERDKLQSSIFSLLTEIADLAEGDLTVEATVDEGLTGSIADSVNYLAESLRVAFKQVGSAAEQLTSSVDDIQMTAGQLAAGSEIQSSQIVDTTAAIDEMALSIQQVSENATISATVGEQARVNAQRGGEAVRATIEGMTRIRSQVQNTAKSIKRLGEGTQEIGEMLQLIRTITKRTSILALNASIQASRAGEAGRGFMVVAEEVEQLAERSADAAKQIELLVQNIQTETNEAVASMEATTHEVVVGSQLANEAGSHLTEIETVTERLSDLIQGISRASQQQARGSESIAHSMNNIAEITQQTNDGTQETTLSIQRLTELADGLREAIDGFKVDEAEMEMA